VCFRFECSRQSLGCAWEWECPTWGKLGGKNVPRARNVIHSIRECVLRRLPCCNIIINALTVLCYQWQLATPPQSIHSACPPGDWSDDTRSRRQHLSPRFIKFLILNLQFLTTANIGLVYLKNVERAKVKYVFSYAYDDDVVMMIGLMMMMMMMIK